MKPLGVVFLLIAIGIALHGYAETGDGAVAPFTASALRKREKIADAKFDEASQTAIAMIIIATGNTSPLHEIKNPIAREMILKGLAAGDKDMGAIQKVTADSFGKMAEQRGELDAIHAEIAEKQKWTYTPAAILAVVGLILLVIPTTPKRDIYLDIRPLPLPPKA